MNWKDFTVLEINFCTHVSLSVIFCLLCVLLSLFIAALRTVSFYFPCYLCICRVACSPIIYTYVNVGVFRLSLQDQSECRICSLVRIGWKAIVIV